ncbi:MAG: hypothetical protein BYD32DRAFT_412439 [Podila humilis]|nr:MAG: hypothetical protein BYD32DRAFT_412439 [Podila humilis]
MLNTLSSFVHALTRTLQRLLADPLQPYPVHRLLAPWGVFSAPSLIHVHVLRRSFYGSQAPITLGALLYTGHFPFSCDVHAYF